MVLGSAGKKIQTIIELAEELYEKVTELREQVAELRDTVEETNDRVGRLERRLAEQRALLSALADERGIDVDEVLEEEGADEATVEGE